jgi:16S rRNA C967 or C1407 C5-methylase (RsmB/RsmF family)
VASLESIAALYHAQYGDDTIRLFAALLHHRDKVSLLNPFLLSTKLEPITALGHKKTLLDSTLYSLPSPCEGVLVDGLMSHYSLDISSVLAPLLLPLKPHMRVLDMCAAPGGKLLVMISRMIEGIEFTANDVSPARLYRLKRVLQQFLPEDFLKRQVKVTAKDAIYFGLKTKNHYDAILLDTPCSSEAHVVKSPSLLKKFTSLKKNLPKRQYSLLCAALLAVKPGGCIAYATCSVNKNENDGVIEVFLKKKGSECTIMDIISPIGKPGPYGISIWPHLHGAGPAFVSLLRKNS